MKNNIFQIVQRHTNLSLIHIKSDSTTNIFKVNGQSVYLEQDQFLAVGFRMNSTVLKCTSNGFSYTLNITEVDRAYGNNTSIKFDKMNKHVGISFSFVHTSGKVIYHKYII